MKIILAVLAGASLVSAVAACGDDGGMEHPDAAAVPDGAPDGPVALRITPPQADVLTCTKQQYATNDVATPAGAWSADRGSISATGLYSAPLSTASGTAAEITYTPGTGAAVHATATLATAFLGAPTTIATGYLDDGTPYEHVVQVSGNRVYAVFPAADGVTVMRSDDGGATFTAKPSLAIAGAKCATAAIDAGNPDVLYVVTHHSSGPRTSVTLHVSEDGGATFPAAKTYVVGDSVLDGLVNAICPDVTSPSADHVVVATGAQTDDQSASWAALYVAGARGADIGTGVGTNSADYYSPADVNQVNRFTDGSVLSDGGQYGPRVFTNGTGTVCTTYSVDSGSCAGGTSCNRHYVQCSTTSGATWSAPRLLASSAPATYPTGSISPSGSVAVTWVDRVGGEDRLELAISRDRGATFAAPVQHPFDAAMFGYTSAPVVAWQGDILWFEETTSGSDQPRIVIDKTCDFGTTWSGVVPVTEGSDYVGAGLLVTPTRVFAIGRNLRDAANRPLSLLPLTH